LKIENSELDIPVAWQKLLLNREVLENNRIIGQDMKLDLKDEISIKIKSPSKHKRRPLRLKVTSQRMLKHIKDIKTLK